nr:hypothetical protein [Acinetobacter sp. YH12023]
MPTKIKDNESIQPLLNLLEFGKISFSVLDKIPFIYKVSPKIKSLKKQFIEIQNQSSILTLPDQFNELFSNEGWICYGALNQSILEESVSLGLDNKIEEAKLLLINSIDEIFIDLVLKKCGIRKHFKLRVELLKLLKIDYLEERYHACIPLLLALIDGLANDISAHIGFFAEKSDLELFDSITAHKTGLPFLKILMNSARKNTTTEKIKIPYRNGILHGRDLNFANKEVASKCWWALASLIEWADEKALNKQPKPPESFQTILKQHQQTRELSKRIGLWKPRPIQPKDYWIVQTLETVVDDSPEFTLLEFLNHWKNKHWGKLPPLLIHNIGKHLGKASQEIKSDYQKSELLNFKIIALEDYTASSTRILTNIQYIKNEGIKDTEINITLNYADSTTGSPELRGEKNGRWYVLQLSLGDILFS